MTQVTRHLIARSDGARVELFQARSPAAASAGAILFVHGNQAGQRLGAVENVDNGTLLRFSAGLNITAAAVSQPGFGASEGPPDFCGPGTQQAILAALSFLRKQPYVDPGRIVLCGNSRGAVASAMVATQVADLRAVVLMSGVYDLEAAFEGSPQGLQLAIEKEAGLSRDAFLARSALHHAHKIRCEAMLLHGRRDDRAPVAQAELFAQALSDAGLPATLSLFDCGHQIPRDYVRAALHPFLRGIFAPAVTLH
ncbi:alpha/beta fold hydrolase [Ensifer sp.]|uniref:alpha/beta hydrolase family protein n=1 Tax=Ensifer sp. TaxID=1872086 RepID=UPI0028965475|nr:prolyl oligopeptidase family serine peptidase [Ensifer sp.]